MTTINHLSGRTLGSIVADFFGTDEQPMVIYCDAGNGCAFGAEGRAAEYDSAWAPLAMTEIPEGEDCLSNDGYETSVQSAWQEGHSGYRWRVRF